MFPVSALESMLEQGWKNPRPSNLGHDAHRPVGWAETLALHLQPRLARLLGRISVVENAEDAAFTEKLTQHFHAQRVAGVDPEKRDRLHSRIREHLSENSSVFATNCVAYKDEGLARRVFADIFARADKDGLVPVAILHPILPGVFEQEGLAFFAHPFFRRALSRFNTLNEPFLKRIQNLSTDSQLDLRIALDPDLVGLAETALTAIELQYWWGPHFLDELPSVQLGVTRHDNDEIERIFNGISRTEFWWYEQEERTFECEEVLDNASLGVSDDHFGCRFVHSIVDAKTGRSKHLDGAVRMYDQEAMLSRLDVDLMHAGRRSQYTKLWRVDQEIDVRTWKALINDYFRDNHLVGEYLGGKEKDDQVTRPRTMTLDSPSASITDFAPCTMSRGDGVRISISYHPKAESLSGERIIVPTGEITLAEGKRSYVEACTFDLIKLLRRRNAPAESPVDAVCVAFQDHVFGLPLIAHCGTDSAGDAQRTLDVIADYIGALVRNQQDRVVGFHIAIRFPDRDVFFSFAGHDNDLDQWLRADCARLPTSRERIGDWAQTATDEITKLFPQARDVPNLENMFKPTGLLTFDRKILTRDEYELQRNTQTGEPVVALKGHPNVLRAMPLIRSLDLEVVSGWRLLLTTCNRCHMSYESCGCIKFIDDDVYDTVEDAHLLGFFWTDRSADNLTWTAP
jgi:hypothetical protein